MRGELGIPCRVFRAAVAAAALAGPARAQAPWPFIIGLAADMSRPDLDLFGPDRALAACSRELRRA